MFSFFFNDRKVLTEMMFFRLLVGYRVTIRIC